MSAEPLAPSAPASEPLWSVGGRVGGGTPPPADPPERVDVARAVAVSEAVTPATP